MCERKNVYKKSYKRILPYKIKGKFFMFLFSFHKILRRLWEIENIIEISIMRGESISFNADKDGKIRIRQANGECSININIDQDYLKKIEK